MNSSHQEAHEPPLEPPRRTFFGWLTAAVGACAAAAAGIPIVGYLAGALERRTRPWIALGSLDSFPANETRMVRFTNPLGQPWDGMTADMGVYVRNLGEVPEGQPRFQVFSMHCTHLGCPVTWFPESGLFMCPCHGGVYYETGERASGPPPRGLFHVAWRENNGQLEIQAPHLPTLQDTLVEDG